MSGRARRRSQLWTLRYGMSQYKWRRKFRRFYKPLTKDMLNGPNLFARYKGVSFSEICERIPMSPYDSSEPLPVIEVINVKDIR